MVREVNESPLALRVGETTREVPLYDPETVDYPALRVALSNGQVKALALAEPTDSRHRVGRIRTPEGIAAIALDNPVHEDFERFATTSWSSGWGGRTPNFEVVTGNSAIHGTRSLRGFADSQGLAPSAVFMEGVSTSRENRYSTLIRFGSEGNTRGGIRANGPGTDATTYYRNSYFAGVNPGTNTLFLETGEGSNQYSIETHAMPIEANRTYHLALDMYGGDTTAILTDKQSREELGRATKAGDTTHTSGALGVSIDGNASTPVYFDNIRREGGPPMGTLAPSGGVIDRFNSASFAAYESTSATAFSFDSTVKREGTHALRLNAYDSGDDYLWSMPGGGLSYYPEVGDSFHYKYRTNATDAHTRVIFHFGKQTAGYSRVPSFFVGHRVDGRFYVGEMTSSGEVQRASATPGYPTGTWLRAEVEWLTATSVRATLYNDQTDAQLAGPITGNMTQSHTGGGIEFFAPWNRNGHIWFDDIVLI